MGSFLSTPHPGRKDEHILTNLKPPRKTKSGHICNDDLPTPEHCSCKDNINDVSCHSAMKFQEQDATNAQLENTKSKKININRQPTSEINSPVKRTTCRIQEKDFPIIQSGKSRSPQFHTTNNYSNDVLKSKRLLEETGFHFLIPQLVYAFNQLQAEASRSSYHKVEIMNYYEELAIQSKKFAFVVTGIIGMGKSQASLQLFERLKNLNEATPFAVRNIRELESIQVFPDIKMTILVDGLFEQITSLVTLKRKVSSLNNFFKLLNTWSENNTIIISMEKEVLNFLKISSDEEEFLQKSLVIDLTNKVEMNMKEIFTHINDMDEKCFSCLSSVLLNPGLRFQCSAASRIYNSDLFRNDFMIPQKIAESFVGIYLEKEDGCYYVNDESIRKVLCQVHLKRNPGVFLEICPLRYFNYLMDHDDVCITEDAFYETLLLRFFNEIKAHPSHSLFEEFARLLEIKSFDEHIFSVDPVKANISQIPTTIRAHLANQLAVSGNGEFSSLIQMLVKDLTLTAKNVFKMSYDDLSKLSDENIAPSRSTFTAIACEFDQTRYEWGQKMEKIYPDCLSNQVLETLVKSVHMTDTLMAKIIIRAVEENFCSQFSVGFESIWTGYRFTKQRVTCNEYAFVINVRKEGIKCTAKEVLPSKYCGFEVLVKGISEVDGESCAIMEDEAKYNLDRNLVIHDWVINSLLQSHSNITGITTSSVLSRNYKSGKPPNIEPVSCIVISCHTKGIIPMGEKPFPTNINGYPVDVRESCAAISAIHHPQIGDRIKASTAGMGRGTLGGFIFVGNNIYYLTAAHVLVLKIHLNENLFENAKKLDVKILREISHEWHECGILDRGYFGNIRLQRIFTVDAVLVNINSEDHKPKHPFLPQENATNAGFLEGSKPFFSGKIKDVSNPDEQLNIVKYGQKTLWTKGRLTSINTMKTINIDQNGSFPRNYFGQMVIISDHGKFAELGDSGSLVFIVSDYNDPELECIGLLNAVDQVSGEVYVTPIRAVLESLRLDENAFKKVDPPFTMTYLNMIRERLDLHTEILLNIDENTREAP